MRKILNKFIKWALQYDEEKSDRCSPISLAGPDQYINNHQSIRSENITFNVYIATGGIVVELTEYDNKTDQYHNKLFITQQETLGKDIEHILLMKLMTR